MVNASGTLHMPGDDPFGSTTGTFQRSDAQGSVTLAQVRDEPLPGFSGPPDVQDYNRHHTIVAGTGAYAEAQASGESSWYSTPEQRPDCPPGESDPLYIVAPSWCPGPYGVAL
jgi:hypothetical protein